MDNLNTFAISLPSKRIKDNKQNKNPSQIDPITSKRALALFWLYIGLSHRGEKGSFYTRETQLRSYLVRESNGQKLRSKT